ncbi:MAG: hypothetical protein AAF944_23235 [Bacteroidota bacterium]
MNISPELLKKYASGTCTEEERKLVEQWLAHDDLSTTSPRAELAEERTQVWRSIIQNVGWSETKVAPMHRRMTRYAAAACVIIGVFAAGFSTGFTFAKPAADTVKQTNQLASLSGLLHIYGGDGAYGVVAGNSYRIEFEGRLGLYNEAPHPKRIVCGEQEFTLKPHQTYYLSGSHQQASIAKNENMGPGAEDKEELELASDFSVIQLD